MAALVLALRGANAQQPLSHTPCMGQQIDDVVIYTAAPTAAPLRRVRLLASVVSAVHTTTHPDIVRRFMMLQPGDLCDEHRRSESERILRAQPFIAEAQIEVVPDSDGHVTLGVHTTDEVALVLGIAASTASPQFRFLRVGDANLSGDGVYLAADWRNGAPFRDGYGLKYVDNLFTGRPYTLNLEGYQTPLGSNWTAGATHPYYTDVQQFAWRARIGANDDYIQFRNDDNSNHALRLSRNFFDVGGIFRVGPRGRFGLVGASVSGDDERTGGEQVLITTQGFAADSSSQLEGRYRDHRIARANLLWGVRDVSFARVSGFDAISGTQDLAVGFQLGSMIGHSLSLLGARDNDVFVSGDLYAGAVGRNNALRVQVQTEGRHDNNADAWDGILMTGRAIQYYKLSPQHTSTLSVEFSGGWRQRIPFNLTLSDPSGGLRGFSSSNTPGGQRLVTRLDNRLFVARPFNLADVAVGAFADAGRLWSGEIPYGVTTPVYSSVGVSLLGAVPIHSSRVWRLDLAYATKREPGGHRFELRVSNTDKTTFFLAEPSDIGATRERTVPSSVFRWPQ